MSTTTLRLLRNLRGESVHDTAMETAIPESWLAAVDRGDPPYLTRQQIERLENHFNRPIADLKKAVKPSTLAALYLSEKDLK